MSTVSIGTREFVSSPAFVVIGCEHLLNTRRLIDLPQEKHTTLTSEPSLQASR